MREKRNGGAALAAFAVLAAPAAFGPRGREANRRRPFGRVGGLGGARRRAALGAGGEQALADDEVALRTVLLGHAASSGAPSFASWPVVAGRRVAPDPHRRS